VGEIDPKEAHDHLAMVDRILAESSQKLCFGGSLFIVWGLYSGIATLGFHFIAKGTLPSQALFAQAALLAICIVYSIWRVRANRGNIARRSIVQREFLNVLYLTLGLAFVANLGAFNLFRGMGAAAIWSFAEAVVLFFIGMHGNRRAQIAGIIVIVSMVVANFSSGDNVAYALAAGMVAGYAGFGVAEELAHDANG